MTCLSGILVVLEKSVFLWDMLASSKIKSKFLLTPLSVICQVALVLICYAGETFWPRRECRHDYEELNLFQDKLNLLLSFCFVLFLCFFFYEAWYLKEDLYVLKCISNLCISSLLGNVSFKESLCIQSGPNWQRNN